MKISKGKRKGLEALTNKKGVIAAAAMDQRGSLLKAIAQGRGVEQSQVKPEDLTEFKNVVTKVLTPHAGRAWLPPGRCRRWGGAAPTPFKFFIYTPPSAPAMSTKRNTPSSSA